MPDKTLMVDILRHGEPTGGDILRGRIDVPLTETGWQQMRSAVGIHTLDATPPYTHIVSSPLLRCSEFAVQAASELGLSASLQIESQWQEIDYGDWDGMLIDEWREHAAAQFAAFRSDLSALQPPNGEAYLDFRDRILTAWQSLSDLPDGSHILLVTHGGVMRVILPTVLGMPLSNSRPLHIPFACRSRIQLHGGGENWQASLLSHNACD